MKVVIGAEGQLVRRPALDRQRVQIVELVRAAGRGGVQYALSIRRDVRPRAI